MERILTNDMPLVNTRSVAHFTLSTLTSSMYFYLDVQLSIGASSKKTRPTPPRKRYVSQIYSRLQRTVRGLQVNDSEFDLAARSWRPCTHLDELQNSSEYDSWHSVLSLSQTTTK